MSDETRTMEGPPPRKTRKQRVRTSPCPRCDRKLPTNDELATCPGCALPLLPVEVAGFFRRLLAAFSDLVLALVIAIPLHLAVNWLLETPAPIPGGSTLATVFQIAAANPLDLFVWALPVVGVTGLYFLLFQTLMGSTPGTRLARIRVINARGKQPHPVRTAVRVLGAGLGLLPLGLGTMWIAFDREKRGLHDHVAGTYVVRVQ